VSRREWVEHAEWNSSLTKLVVGDEAKDSLGLDNVECYWISKNLEFI
jgi:hypothetical protein